MTGLAGKAPMHYHERWTNHWAGRPDREDMMAGHTNAFPDLERELRFCPLGVDSPGTVSREQISRYNDQGFLAPVDVFSDREVADIREYFDRLLTRALAAGWTAGELTNWHLHCRGVYDLVTHPRIVDIVEDFLGSTVILRNCHFFIKLPGDSHRVSWHQDASYWPLTPSKVISVWLAIDDSCPANGAMQVIPRSHLHPGVPFRRSAPEEHNVLSQTVDNPERYGDAPISLELKAGQISLHSDWILHGSEPNRSDRRRCGLAMRYLSCDVRASDGWNKDSVICRGEDPSGHWSDHPRPAHDSIPGKQQGAGRTTRSFTHGWTDRGATVS